ncbi:MAG: hypothetical protein IPK82_35910 [Polyangiaceae bacterium]|nr:hypothetical protein [Polyangiaceae bacterium]
MDTTKDYYEDSECPAEQVQVFNGVEQKIPWKDVPPGLRFFLEYDNPPKDKPRVRVPIIKVVTTSLDAENKPVPLDKAAWYQLTEFGINPKYKRNSMGGNKH